MLVDRDIERDDSPGTGTSVHNFKTNVKHKHLIGGNLRDVCPSRMLKRHHLKFLEFIFLKSGPLLSVPKEPPLGHTGPAGTSAEVTAVHVCDTARPSLPATAGRVVPWSRLQGRAQ